MPLICVALFPLFLTCTGLEARGESGEAPRPSVVSSAKALSVDIPLYWEMLLFLIPSSEPFFVHLIHDSVCIEETSTAETER
jgi:hypothetical protein